MHGRGPCRIEVTHRMAEWRSFLPLSSPDDYIFSTSMEADDFIRTLDCTWECLYIIKKRPYLRTVSGYLLTEPVKVPKPERVSLRPLVLPSPIEDYGVSVEEPPDDILSRPMD